MDDARRRARGARWPAFRGVDRDRRRRRQQHDRAAARIQPGLAGRRGRARHDGGNAADDAARRRSVDAVGGVRIRSARVRATSADADRLGATPAWSPASAARRLRVHLSQARSRQRRHRLCARALPASRSTRAPYELQRGFVDHLQRRGDRRGRIGAAELHAVSHPGRRSAPPPGTRPRAAGGRRGRVRQRLHGRGDLLRDGVGRSRRQDGPRRAVRRARRWPARYARACDDEIGAELTRFGADPAVSVRRSPPDRTGRSRAPGVRRP